jgi:tRNA-modifying protein YgfZ
MISPEPYRALHGGAGLLDRSHRGRLRLRGNDRREYLQGLLTNDIVALQPGRGCYAALLNAQGRMLADMYLVETGEDILMDLEREATTSTAEHLDRFIFSEDVQVSNESDSLAQLGVYGPQSAAVVARALALADGTSALDGLGVMDNCRLLFDGIGVVAMRRDDAGVEGFDLVVETTAAGALRSALHAAGAVEVDASTAEVVRVEAGVPRFTVDMDIDTIPLEAGIEDRAISQTKGCYVGQEIIIRVLHRGQGRVARRLVGLALEASAIVPAKGDRIRSGEREVGTVTSAVASPALGRPLALGYVHRDFTAPATAVSIASGDVVQPAVVTAFPLHRSA